MRGTMHEKKRQRHPRPHAERPQGSPRARPQTGSPRPRASQTARARWELQREQAQRRGSEPSQPSVPRGQTHRQQVVPRTSYRDQPWITLTITRHSCGFELNSSSFKSSWCSAQAWKLTAAAASVIPNNQTPSCAHHRAAPSYVKNMFFVHTAAWRIRNRWHAGSAAHRSQQYNV